MVKASPIQNGATPNRQLLTPGGISTFDAIGSTAGNVADEVTITRNSDGKLEVMDDGITSAQIVANAVGTTEIADGAVTSAKIADGTIVNADVNAAAAIVYSKLALSNSIDAGDLTANSVTTAKIDDAAVTFDKLAPDAVVFGTIAPDAIDTDNILDGAVTPAKIGTVALSDATAPTTDSANIDEQIGYLANRIKAISGESGWKSDPDMTIAAIAANGVFDGDTAGGDLSGTYPNPVVRKASKSFALSGIITPSALTANTHNYNPTGLADASLIVLTTDGDPYQMTGMEAPAEDGTIVGLFNADPSYIITLEDESGSSTSTNRFDFTSDLWLYPGESVVLIYNGIRWQTFGERGVVLTADGGGGGLVRRINIVSGGGLTATIGTVTDGVLDIGFSIDPPTTTEIDATDFPYAMSAAIERYYVNESAGTGALAFTVPPSADCQIGQRFAIMDIAGYAATRNITLQRAGSDTINGVTTAITVAALAYAGCEIEYRGSGAFHLFRYTA